MFSVCGDIHLTTNVPKCRGESQEDWIKLQLNFIHLLGKEPHSIIAGDIFDKPSNNSSKYINTVIDVLSHYEISAISGNHDTPLRNLSYLKYSDYSLVSKAIPQFDMNYRTIESENHMIYGIPWCPEEDFRKEIASLSKDIDVLIIHRMVYDTKPYPNANPVNSASYTLDMIPDHIKLVIAGDNHSKFIFKKDDRVLLNCGTPFRDRADLIDYKPSFFRIQDDLSIEEVLLDISEDKITDNHIVEQKKIEEREEKILLAVSKEIDVSNCFRSNLFSLCENKISEPYLKKLYEVVNDR